MNLQEILAELRTLDGNNPGAWPLWARVGASVIVGIFVLAAGIYMLVKPVYEDLQNVEREEETLRKTFETNQAKAAALDSFKAQLTEMEKDFGAMLKQLPSKSQVEKLLTDISQARVASSLEEELFQPQSDIPKEFYAEIPNRIIVTGTYHEMANFVSAVAALPRIVTIEEVDLGPLDNSAPKPGTIKEAEGRLRMTAVAKTYRYLDDDELAAEQDKQAAASAKPGK